MVGCGLSRRREEIAVIGGIPDQGVLLRQRRCVATVGHRGEHDRDRLESDALLALHLRTGALDEHRGVLARKADQATHPPLTGIPTGP